MSNTLAPLAAPTPRRRNPSIASNISLPPLSSWCDGPHALLSFSSSPPRSSSPPMTPHSSRSNNHAYIRSSPAFGSEIANHPSFHYIDELPSAWDRSHIQPPVKQRDAPVSLPGFKSFFSDASPDSQPTRCLASPKSSEHASYFNEYSRNDTHRQSKSYVPVFSDSEEEEQEDDSEGYSFVEEDTRATFFRTSAERGQWKYDPIPLKIETRSLLRQSAPTSSPPPILGLQLLARPISEPAPSTGRTSTPPTTPDSHEEGNNGTEMPSMPCVDNMLPDHLTPAIHDTSCSLPSLASDRESTEPEDNSCPSSPLPPSSPPLSSHPPSRSISPLSFAPSSPHLVPSSPLSFVDSVPSDDDQDMDLQSNDEADTITTPHPQPVATLESQAHSEPALTPADPEAAPTPRTSAAQPPELAPEPLSSAAVLDASSDDVAAGTSRVPVLSPTLRDYRQELPISEVLEESATMSTGNKDLDVAQIGGDGGDEEMVAIPVTMEIGGDANVTEPLEEGQSSARDGEVEALKPKDDNGAVRSSGEGSGTSNLKEKRKKEDGQVEGPARKKSRVASEEPASGSRTGSPMVCVPEKKKARKQAKRKLEEEEEEEGEEENKQAAPAPKAKNQKRTDREAPAKRARQQTTSTVSKSRSASSSKPRPVDIPIPKSKPAPKDPETEALDAEICGMLIESMATSRASCLAASTLYKNVMQSRPSLKAERSEKEWMGIIQRVLHEGEASRGGSGVFGKVESSFKARDDSDRPLEAQWFYVPELDEDQERATLIRSMMPRPGKRSTTKKYKQYYYRPLDKISRWDPEDEI